MNVAHRRYGTHRYVQQGNRNAWDHAPYRQHPGRREHVYGPIIGMDPPPSKRFLVWAMIAALVLGMIGGMR